MRKLQNKAGRHAENNNMPYFEVAPHSSEIAPHSSMDSIKIKRNLLQIEEQPEPTYEEERILRVDAAYAAYGDSSFFNFIIGLMTQMKESLKPDDYLAEIANLSRYVALNAEYREKLMPRSEREKFLNENRDLPRPW